MSLLKEGRNLGTEKGSVWAWSSLTFLGRKDWFARTCAGLHSGRVDYSLKGEKGLFWREVSGFRTAGGVRIKTFASRKSVRGDDQQRNSGVSPGGH